jgi:hypothetical protein
MAVPADEYADYGLGAFIAGGRSIKFVFAKLGSIFK